MSAIYTWTGPTPPSRIGWARKPDAVAVARRHPAGRVVRVDFRLHGRGWVALNGLGERMEIIAADGSRLPAVACWDGQRHAISLDQDRPTR